MNDAGQWYLFAKSFEIAFHPNGFETQIFCRLTEVQQIASGPTRACFFANALQRDVLAKMFGQYLQTGWPTVFAFGLFKIGEFQSRFFG